MTGEDYFEIQNLIFTYPMLLDGGDFDAVGRLFEHAVVYSAGMLMADRDPAAMAASLPGVLLVPGLDGGPDGFSVLGLGADQNSVTLNGMQVGANGLPRDAAISSSLSGAQASTK